MTTRTATMQEQVPERSESGTGATAARLAATKGPTPRTARSRGSDADALGLFLRDLEHHPLPDHEAQTELAKRVAAGDEEARREMVAANLRLVVHWARQVPGPRESISPTSSRRGRSG